MRQIKVSSLTFLGIRLPNMVLRKKVPLHLKKPEEIKKIFK